MLRRNVVESKHLRVPAKCFEVALVCGHVTRRRDKTGKPPRYVVCTDCEKLLERCQEQEGWFQAKAVRGTRAAMQLLAEEGHLESRRDGTHSMTYWKLTE